MAFENYEKGYHEADSGLIPIRNKELLPTAKLDDQKFEFYFLVDVSGSMEGQPWELACRALLLFLQSLPEDCYFNIIAFSHVFQSMFPNSVKYSQETLNQAKSLVPSLFTAGGTDILSPLRHIYQQRQVTGYLTQIFSLTDGYVDDSNDVIKLVASNLKHSRSFSLGIGNNVDRKLVKGIAKHVGGMYQFVTDNEFIESKVLNQLKISLQPALLKPIRDASASRLIPMY